MRRIQNPFIRASAEQALLTGLTASALVLTASLFGQQFAALLTDLSCNASPSCAVRVERSASGQGPAGEQHAASRDGTRDR